MRAVLTLAVTSLLLVLAAPVCAQAGPALPDWEHLSPAQREVLVAPIRERWNASPDSRPRMLHHAEGWRAMTPQQREQARSGHDRFQTMTPEQREQARAAYERFRALSPDDKRALRQKLRAMTPEQRKAWMRSRAGGDMPADR